MVDVVQRARRLRRAGRGQTKGIRLESVLDPQRGRVSGDPRPPAAGVLEPAQQRGQVHAQGRPGPGRAAAGELAHRVQRQRHRHRHSGRLPAARVRAVLAERQLDQPAATAGWGWGSRSASSWSSCTAARSRRRAWAKAKARLSSSRCRSSSSAKEKDPAARVHPTAAEPSDVIPVPQAGWRHGPSSSTTKPTRSSSSSGFSKIKART